MLLAIYVKYIHYLHQRYVIAFLGVIIATLIARKTTKGRISLSAAINNLKISLKNRLQRKT